MTHRIRTLALATCALVALAPVVAAQAVTGRFVDEGDGAPLGGARISLVDAGGAVVASTISAGDGSFSLPSSRGAGVTCRAELVGYEAAEAPALPEAGDVPVELRAARVTLALPGATTKVDKECRVDPATATRIAVLWTEVRKALQVTVQVQDAGLLRYEIATWYRQLNPRNLKVVEEGRSPRPGFHPVAQTPSPPAAALAREGYVQGGGEGEGVAFYGPDARTLLSPVFADTHCFGFQESGPEDGWVGLTFEPRDPQARDVRGTLWIDAATYAPRRLVYAFTRLPWSIKTDKVGGQVDFRQVMDGPWVVARWWIRMPRLGVQNARITQWDPPSTRLVLSAVVEEGGEVLRVQDAHGTIEALR